MRESIGASWLLVIVMTFIVLFSCFLAYSVNYSKAFKVKDSIIDQISKYNGFNDQTIGAIDDKMDEVGYSSTGKCSNLWTNDDDSQLAVVGVVYNPVGGSRSEKVSPGSNERYNYCIQKIRSKDPKGQMTGSYYRVAVFFSLSIPIINLGSTFHVDGETNNLYFPQELPMLNDNAV